MHVGMCVCVSRETDHLFTGQKPTKKERKTVKQELKISQTGSNLDS